jgi:hypothetical protein
LAYIEPRARWQWSRGRLDVDAVEAELVFVDDAVDPAITASP